MPVPLYNVAIGQVIQPHPIRYGPLPQQADQVENEQTEQRTEAPRRTEPVERQTNVNSTNRSPVTFVRESVELDRLLSGEKGILIDILT